MIVVELSKFAKYAQILKNSMVSKGTASARVSLMKDRAAVDGAVGFCIHMSQKYYTHRNCLLFKSIIQPLRSHQNAL
jgi:hypothetical protein